MRKFFKALGLHELKRFYYLLKLPFTPALFKSESYFPEFHRKPTYKIFWEQLVFILRYNEPNKYYFLYGFDVKSKVEQKEYMPYSIFRRKRNSLNMRSNFLYKHAEHFNYLCLLRDKFYFGQILGSLGFDTPENLYYINGVTKTFFDLQGKREYSLSFIQTLEIDGFCKMLIGECGVGVFALKIQKGQIYINNKESSLDALFMMTKNSRFLIQRRVVQHSELSRLYSLSVNTLRIITCCDGNGRYHVLSGVLRVGANGNRVDNWAAGGLVVGIEDDGCLKKYGFYEFKNQKLAEHPDSHVQFEDFQLPFYKECLARCLELHSFFYGIPTIGWDVALTDNGPCFIEGNDNYELSLNQVADKGLKHEWMNVYKTEVPTKDSSQIIEFTPPHWLKIYKYAA